MNHFVSHACDPSPWNTFVDPPKLIRKILHGLAYNADPSQHRVLFLDALEKFILIQSIDILLDQLDALENVLEVDGRIFSSKDSDLLGQDAAA